MSDQPTAQPSFHEAYDSLVAGLPASQLREAHKRLVKCKQPLTADELVSEHPRVLACLERIVAAYGRKKSRSAVASKVRRDAARDKPADAATEVDVPEQEGVEDDIASSLSACTVTCVSDAIPVVLVPAAPEEQKLVPPPTKPSRTPQRSLVRAAAPSVAPAPSVAAAPKKRGVNSLISQRPGR